MSLLGSLLDRQDPLEERALYPQVWDRGGDYVDGYSPAGVRVDRDAILGISAVWACVSLISDSIATLPLGVFKTVNDAPSPQPFPSWMQEPNPEQTLVDFIFGTVASLLLHGNAYIYTVRDAKLNIVEAWILDPRWVYVRREWLANGQLGLRYYVQVGKGMQSPVGPFVIDAGPDMFHIMGFQPSSSWPMGISPLDNARMMFGSAIAGQEMGTRWFSQGFNASGVIETDDDFTVDQAKQLKEDFRQANTGGPSKMHYPPVLTGGATWKQIQISPEQAQFLEQRQFALDEIARWYRVPPHMIGNLEKTSSWGTGIEQQFIGYVKTTLRPWISRIERSWTDNLLTFQPGQYFHFDTTDMLKGDMQALSQYAMQMHMSGMMNANELRAKFFDLAPYEDGDRYYFQTNTAPIGDNPITLAKDKEVIGPGAPVLDAQPATPANSDSTGANLQELAGETRQPELHVHNHYPELNPPVLELKNEITNPAPEIPESRVDVTVPATDLKPITDLLRDLDERAAEREQLRQAELMKALGNLPAPVVNVESPPEPRSKMRRIIRDKAGKVVGSEEV